MAKKKAVKVGDRIGNAVAVEHDTGATSNKVDVAIPTVAPPDPGEVAVAETEPEDPPETAPATYSAIIEVPLQGGYDAGPGHVEARLDRRQSTILRRVQAALDVGNHRMANGRHVHTRADAVRWLIEQIGTSD